MKTRSVDREGGLDPSRSWLAITNKAFSRNWPYGLQSICIIVLLGAVNWLAHFSLARSFGLYEDDYYFISPAFGMSLQEVFAEVTNNFLKWPQGRPIGFSLPLILSFIGYRLDGLYGIYIIAFLILCLNTYLLYLLVRKFGSMSLALVAALAFSLFPADTTRSFLMHGLGLQPSITFLLIASLFYLDNRKGVAYLFILGALLTYETPFLVFWGIPFIQFKRGRYWTRQFLLHISILVGITFCALIIRTVTGDSRLQMGGFMLIPFKVFLALIIGPLTSFGLFFYALIITFLNLNAIVICGILVSLVFTGFACYVLILKPIEETGRFALENRSNYQRADKWRASPKVRLLIRSSLIGLILLCLGYGLSFTHFPPTAYHGRLASVHLAASIGGSILFASLCILGLSIVNRLALLRTLMVIMALYFSSLVGYNTVIQESFIKSWCNQKSFWTNTLPLIPDLTAGTVILFPYNGSAETAYIHTHSWADSLILKQLYEFPNDWKNPPRLYTVSLNWLTILSLNNERIYWNVPAGESSAHVEALPESNVILLQQNNASVSRKTGVLLIFGREFHLKQPLMAPSAVPYGRRPLYDLLISSENQCGSRN